MDEGQHGVSWEWDRGVIHAGRHSRLSMVWLDCEPEMVPARRELDARYDQYA